MSAAAGASRAATSPPRYFCHKCERTVSVTPAADGELYCTVCNNSFVEEMENPNPNIPSSPFIPASPLTFLFGGPPFSGSPLSGGSFSGGPFSFDVRSPSDLSGLFGGDPAAHAAAASPSAGPEPFNPFAFIQNHLHDLTSNGGSIQFVIDGSPGVGGAANLGDYFFGSGLEQLIQQLAENDPNRYGTPPASKSAVESLPNVAVSQHLMDSGEAQCAVCMDDFEVGAEGKQMPCKHLFHKDCILPWLALHNSCPVCRFELPTDDPDYEHRVRGAPAPTERVPAGSGSAGGPATARTDARTDGRADARANATGPRVIERRFRITLPWPFQGLGQNGEGGDNGNDSSGAGWDTNFDGR